VRPIVSNMLIANLQSLFLQISYATLVALLLLTFSPRPVGAIAAYLYLSARTIARALLVLCRSACSVCTIAFSTA
jgi:hypothetical protein